MFDRVARIALVSVAAGLFAAGCAGRRDPIRIGIAGALSDPIGAPMRMAARLAAKEINASGGIGGRPLELVERDDYGDPDSAVFVATDLYHSDVAAVVGHLYSGTTLAASPVYNGGANPLVAISPSSSSPEISLAGAYTFRVCPSDLAHGAALARWVWNQLHLRTGAVLYLNDQYGRGVRQTFVQEFVRMGGSLTSVDPYLGSTPDVGPYLDRMVRRDHPEFLVVAGNKSEAAEIIRQARRRGLTMPVVGADGLEGIEQEGALSEGVYESAAYLPTTSTESNRRFVRAYQQAYPGSGLPNQPAAATYDAIYLLRDVIARAGNGRNAIRRALSETGSSEPAFEGVTGSLAFDAAGDVPTKQVYIGVVRGGAVFAAEK